MKVMKKVLVLALAAATIMLAACNNGNGGEPSDVFVAPTLPESKGTDPFAGLETLTPAYDTTRRYLVDTEKKVLTEQSLADDGTTWNPTAEYRYSYDGTVNPPTVTGRIEAQYEKGKRLTPTEELAAYEAEFKTGFTQGFEEMFDQLSGLDATTKEIQLAKLNEQYGLTLTVADLAADKKGATLEKVWNSKTVQDMLKEQQDTLKKMFSMTPTYSVTLTEKSGTTAKLAVEGQYDSTLAWYEQQSGSFENNSSGNTIDASFNNGFGYIYIMSSSISYNSSAFTANSITCTFNGNETKTFSYTTTGSGKDTVVTITVDDGTKVECTWQPSTIIGQY